MIADDIGPDRILVLDEGQNLNQRHKKTSERGASFGWLQGHVAKGGFKLIIIGDLTLSPMIEADKQLHTLMIRWRKINTNSRADVAAYLSDTELDTPEIVEVLYQVARRTGGLRMVKRVIDAAQGFAGQGALTTEYRTISPVFYTLKDGSITRVKGAGLVHKPHLEPTALAAQENTIIADMTVMQCLATTLKLAPYADAETILVALEAVLTQADEPEPTDYAPVAAPL